MKKRKGKSMRKEVDFSGGVRGKYVDRIGKDTVFVGLDPDVAAAYPDSKTLNDALRKLAGLPTPRKRKK
jgi:hypothetical protein